MSIFLNRSGKKVRKASRTGRFRRNGPERASFSGSGVKRSPRPSEASLDSACAHHPSRCCQGLKVLSAHCYDWGNAPRAPKLGLWPQRHVSGDAGSWKGKVHIWNVLCNLISCLVSFAFKTNAAPSAPSKADVWNIQTTRRVHPWNTSVKHISTLKWLFFSKNCIFKIWFQ